MRNFKSLSELTGFELGELCPPWGSFAHAKAAKAFCGNLGHKGKHKKDSILKHIIYILIYIYIYLHITYLFQQFVSKSFIVAQVTFKGTASVEGTHGELRSRLSHTLRGNGATGVPKSSQFPSRKVFASCEKVETEI